VLCQAPSSHTLEWERTYNLIILKEGFLTHIIIIVMLIIHKLTTVVFLSMPRLLTQYCIHARCAVGENYLFQQQLLCDLI